MSENTDFERIPGCRWPDCRNVCGIADRQPHHCQIRKDTSPEIVLHDFSTEQRFGYLLRWEVHAVYITATAYWITGAGDDELIDFFLESRVSDSGTDKLEEADVFLEMQVKWDGCINVDIQKNFHRCEGEDIRQIGELMKYIYVKAARLLNREDLEVPTWDIGDGVNPVSRPLMKTDRYG